MARLLTWVLKNLDAFIGLLLALTVAILGLNNGVSQDVVNSAILLILGLLAQALLRDRLRRETAEREVRQVVRDTAIGSANSCRRCRKSSARRGC